MNYEQPVKMAVGGRGIGKTYSLKSYLFAKKMKDEKYEVIWLYRYDIDITPEKIERWADDLPIELQELVVCGERKIQWINENGEKSPFITFVALSKYGVGKGTPYPNVKLVVFDEFIVDNDSRYLKNEIFAFKQWIQTIFRTRKINVVMLANSLTIDNPYFKYFKVVRKPNERIFKTKKVVVEYPENKTVIMDKSNISAFTSLFDDEETKKYDVDGDFYFDTTEFICGEKPKNSKPIYKVCVSKDIFTVYKTQQFY